MSTQFWKSVLAFTLGTLVCFGAGVLVGLLSGCIGPAFVGVEAEEDPDVVVLVTGSADYPEQDVCATQGGGRRTAPDLDAGRGR